MGGLAFVRDVGALERQRFDAAVIGGGVVGACIARDAARRGLRVALVEAGDFCSATSEAMSHLVHGGIRYIAQGQFGHLGQALAERATWMRIAPHQVSLQPCLTPIAGKRWPEPLVMRAAVALFNALGGRNVVPPGEARRAYLDAAAALAAEPRIAMQGLSGALAYHDCRIDEPERIVLGVIKDAARHGAVAANHVACAGLAVENGRVEGVKVVDRIGGATGRIRASIVVNATGAWSAALASRLLPGQTGARLTMSKGIHLVTGPIASRHCLNLAGRREHACVLPWRGFSLIGTTDELYEGDPRDVTATDGDVERLTAKVIRLLPQAQGALQTVHARFASLRALPGSTEDTYTASRETAIVHHAGDGATGFVSVFGGKWTTARRMAQDAVDALVPLIEAPLRPCDTGTSALAEAPSEGFEACVAGWRRKLAAWPEAEVRVFVAAYGSALDGVVGLLADPDAAGATEREHARFAYAVRHEMAVTAEDVARRLARWYEIERPGVAQRAAAWLEEQRRNGDGAR